MVVRKHQIVAESPEIFRILVWEVFEDFCSQENCLIVFFGLQEADKYLVMTQYPYIEQFLVILKSFWDGFEHV